MPIQTTTEEKALTILTFDLNASYTIWQRLEMLLTHTPLLNLLPAVLLASYKKVRINLTHTDIYCGYYNPYHHARIQNFNLCFQACISSDVKKFVSTYGVVIC